MDDDGDLRIPVRGRREPEPEDGYSGGGLCLEISLREAGGPRVSPPIPRGAE